MGLQNGIAILRFLWGLGLGLRAWDLESDTPNMVPYTTIGDFLGIPTGDLLSRCSQGSGKFVISRVFDVDCVGFSVCFRIDIVDEGNLAQPYIPYT